MKIARKIGELPESIIKAFCDDCEIGDDDIFEIEDIYDWVLLMGYDGDPKKKGDYYIGKSKPMEIGKLQIIAQYKQYIKDYDCICDKEFDCLLYK